LWRDFQQWLYFQGSGVWADAPTNWSGRMLFGLGKRVGLKLCTFLVVVGITVSSLGVKIAQRLDPIVVERKHGARNGTPRAHLLHTDGFEGHGHGRA
jgi:hypothetical protein